MPAECNATHFAVKKDTKDAQDGETIKPIHCNDLQERFNMLTREKNLLQNKNNMLRNTLRMVTEERDKLRNKQTFGRKIINSWDEGKYSTWQLFLIGIGTLHTGDVGTKSAIEPNVVDESIVKMSTLVKLKNLTILCIILHFSYKGLASNKQLRNLGQKHKKCLL